MAMVIEAVSGPRPSARDQAQRLASCSQACQRARRCSHPVSPPRSEPRGGGGAIDAVELGNILKYLMIILVYRVADGYGARR
jgi:hypothetical protein